MPSRTSAVRYTTVTENTTTHTCIKVVHFVEMQKCTRNCDTSYVHLQMVSKKGHKKVWW